MIVSIPQAVSTVATTQRGGEKGESLHRFNTASGKYCCNTNVAVAMLTILRQLRFNTASGKYCCNHKTQVTIGSQPLVSIPQAVSTVATCYESVVVEVEECDGFNTASGKYCCNYRYVQFFFAELIRFQYRKR